MRKKVTMNDNWKFVKTADDAQAAAQARGESVTLPHTWNAIDGQDGGNDYHRGTCWYVRELGAPEHSDTDRVYLEFLGAAMTAEVYLNGKKVSRHEGGYSTFRVDITDHLAENNVLTISVDNSDTVECKAGEHVKAKSLMVYCEKYKPQYAIRMSGRNFGMVEGIRSVPLYAVFCLGDEAAP